MASFNSMPAMSSGATPGTDALGLTTSEMDMDAFNACIAFDEALLDPHSLPNLPFTPTPYDLETFSTTFEDPFSYPARPSFETTPGIGPGTLGTTNPYTADDDDGTSPQELDNKLLGFGAPIPSGKATLIIPDGGPGGSEQFVEPAMTGELYGMFFVAEDVFGDANAAGRPLELTCYRRNLWQISGQITLPRNVAHYVDEQGRRAPVVELAASITAMESIEGRVAEMITIPWRGSTSNAPLGAEETKVVAPPPVVPLDLSGGLEVDGGSRVSMPVSWKRLQFKHATANNGRRKGLQQHYVVQINLLVKGKSGEHIKVAEIQSGPVIVRGRSPRNFDSRKEVPLGDKRPLERRNTEAGSAAGGGGAKQQQHHQQQQQQHAGQDGGDLSQMLRYSRLQQSPPEWATPRLHPITNPQHPSKKQAISSPNLSRPPVPSWGSLDASSNNTNLSHPNPLATKTHRSSVTASTPQPLPINLSLSEDERSPNQRSSPNDGTLQSPQLAKSSSALLSASGNVPGGGPGQGTHGAVGHNTNNTLMSPMETEEDMLYEYFPLSLDDWMPPVDAIYRPHVVHHTIVPPEVKAQQMRSKAKRYFAAE